MTKLFDQDGNPAEGALTADEAAAAEQQARQDEAAKILADLDKGGDGNGGGDGGDGGEGGGTPPAKPAVADGGEKTVEQLQAELEALNKELVGLRDKDRNFANLEKARDDAEAKVKTAEEALAVKDKEKDEAVFVARIDAQIEGLAGGDEKLSKKIRFHYGQIKKDDDPPELRQKKVTDAYVLAVGVQLPGAAPDLSAISVAAGTGAPPVAPEGEEELTPDQKELGKKLGLSDEDMRKHGGAWRTHTVREPNNPRK